MIDHVGSSAAQPMRAPRPASRWILVVPLSLLLLWVGWWGSKRLMWWTPAGADIATVVRGAAGVNETLLTPPQVYRKGPITAAELSRLVRVANVRLASYYTGAELRFWRATATRTLNGRDFYGPTYWRVNWIRLGELTLLSGRATATASAEFESNGGAVNRVDYTFSLVSTRAGWRIDRETFDFQPGYGP